MLRVLCSLLLAFSTILQVSCSDEKHETVGDYCTDHHGEIGTCTRFSNCESINEEEENMREKIVNCSSALIETVICCPKPKPARITSSPQSLPKRKPGERSKEFCIKMSNINHADAGEHISHGTRAYAAEFPHMVALGYKSHSTNGKILYLCGGSLISSKFVLTAAHCLSSYGEYYLYEVKIGRVSLLNKTIDDCPDKSNKTCDSDPYPSIDIRVKQNFNIPQDYVERVRNGISYNDIALVELEEEVNYEDKKLRKHIKPACLYYEGAKYKPDVNTLGIAGWGKDETKVHRSSWLMKGLVQEVPYEDCKKVEFFKKYLPRGILYKSHICAIGRNVYGQVVDTCLGDSGTPLHERTFDLSVKGAGSNQMYIVKGVTSFGSLSCNDPNIPGIYTSVAAYIGWIEDIVWPTDIIK